MKGECKMRGGNRVKVEVERTARLGRDGDMEKTEIRIKRLTYFKIKKIKIILK